SSFDVPSARDQITCSFMARLIHQIGIEEAAKAACDSAFNGLKTAVGPIAVSGEVRRTHSRLP
ncbi:unnamed protein product, partial [Musa acuminata subsp. burmannicoides]